jgi:predicted Zn-ribbon and HTH transcriptional regulator
MMVDDVESLWEMLLSRHPVSILEAFQSLSSEEKEQVLNHLVRMTKEEGWHPEQILSAQTALDVLKMQKSRNGI